MPICERIYELHVHPYGLSTLLHTTFNDMGDPELLRDLGQVFRCTLVLEG